MGKGFLRRFAAPLGGAVLLAGLSSGPRTGALLRGEPSARAGIWWEVRLNVSVRGEYTVRGGPAPLRGEYAGRARWEGRLEQDGDDFLLVHIKTEILDWRLREASGPAGRENVIEAPAGAQPDLRMNYVLKDAREVEFVFDFEGLTIPLHASPLAVPLELPRTSGRAPGQPGQGYGDFVRSGSCRVAIPETDLLGRSPERRFAWDWRRERRYFKEGAVLFVVQGHTAEAVVTVAAH